MIYKIYSPLQMQFAAMILENNLKKLGVPCKIVDKIDPYDDENIWIFYNCAMNYAMPPYYIAYQTEQAGTHWFDNKYRQRLKKAIAIWEYSEANLKEYKHLNKNISIVSPGIWMQPKVKKDIPVLFYGGMSNRRKAAISKMNVKVITNTLGHEMRKLLSRAQLVVNIHYYDKSPLETFRINECLSHHCHVISEHSISGDNQYADIVKFGSIDELPNMIKDYGEFNYDITPYDNLAQIKAAIGKVGVYVV